jgi:thymidylate synthase
MQIAIDIREYFVNELKNKRFVVDKTGVKTLEMIGASFLANEECIFGSLNHDYIQRELDWYKSMSLNVNDMPGGIKQETSPPEIWMSVADSDGMINSNYGWAIWHSDNFNQYKNVLNELKKNPNSRRAIMIYTRPSMWLDYNKNGRSDFMCTNSVQYIIRNDMLYCIVQMRSNDLIFGYRNDRSWQDHVQTLLCEELSINKGPIIWQVGSLHVYERHFYLIDHFSKTNEINVLKKNYNGVYR